MSNSSTRSTNNIGNKANARTTTAGETVKNAGQPTNSIREFQVIGREENKYYKAKVVTMTKTIIK